MNINLLAGSAVGLFIAMLIIMIVVTLLFGFMLLMVFRYTKKPPQIEDATNIKKMLARRESQLAVEIMQNQEGEAKKAELVNKLRRVKSAQALVDELLAEEKAINKQTEEEEQALKAEKEEQAKGGEKKPARPANGGGQRSVRRPVTERPAGKKPGEQSDNKADETVKEKPAEKPAGKKPKATKKKKDNLEFNPSED